MNTNTQTRTAVDAIEEMTAEVTGAIERIYTGDYYGDPLPDLIGDIALSLRVLSGREKLSNK